MGRESDLRAVDVARLALRVQPRWGIRAVQFAPTVGECPVEKVENASPPNRARPAAQPIGLTTPRRSTCQGPLPPAIAPGVPALPRGALRESSAARECG